MNTWAWTSWTAGGVLALIGLITLLWALRGDRSRGRRRCPRCWYDMAKTSGAQCPECGRTQKVEKRFFRSRRRWRAAALGVLLLALGVSTAIAPDVYTGRWVRWAPTPLLRAVLGQFQSDAKKLYDGFTQTNRPPPPTLTTWQRLLLAYECGERLQIPSPLTAFEPGLLVRYHPGANDIAADMLIGLGDEARVASDSLTTMLAEPYEGAQNTALRAIEDLGPKSPWLEKPLRRALSTAPAPETRIAVIAAIVMACKPPAQLPAHETRRAIRAACRDHDRRVRIAALTALCAFESNANDDYDDENDSLFNDLIVHDPDEFVRRLALHAMLRGHGIIEDPDIMRTVYVNDDADRSQRKQRHVIAQRQIATEFYSALRPSRRVADPRLSPSPSIVVVIPTLIAALNDTSLTVQTDAAVYLEAIGPAAQAAAPAVRAALERHREGSARTAFFRGLTSIDSSPSTLDLLVEELGNEQPVPQSCLWVINTLGRHGKAAAVRADAVSGIMHRCDWAVGPGVNTLRAMERPIFPVLKSLLASPTAEIRAAACRVAVECVEPPCELCPSLWDALRDPDGSARADATKALARCPASFERTYAEVRAVFNVEGAIPVRYDQLRLIAIIEQSDPVRYRGGLTDALRDPFWHLRSRAVAALADVGPAAAYAIPALQACLDDPELDVRDAAKAALRKIQPDSDTGGVE